MLLAGPEQYFLWLLSLFSIVFYLQVYLQHLSYLLAIYWPGGYSEPM